MVIILVQVEEWDGKVFREEANSGMHMVEMQVDAAHEWRSHPHEQGDMHSLGQAYELHNTWLRLLGLDTLGRVDGMDAQVELFMAGLGLHMAGCTGCCTRA